METQLEQQNYSKQRSARRLRHEAQVKVFSSEAGELEEIRNRLGLRQSQISEILKVHPSAWIRWTRAGKAPPHVYQMLEWYMELLKWRGQNKQPQGFPQKEDQMVQEMNSRLDQVTQTLKGVSQPQNHEALTKVFKYLTWTWVLLLLTWVGFMVFLVKNR